MRKWQGITLVEVDWPPDKMLNEYYSYRGWSEEGIPSGVKIMELVLLDVRV